MEWGGPYYFGGTGQTPMGRPRRIPAPVVDDDGPNGSNAAAQGPGPRLGLGRGGIAGPGDRMSFGRGEALVGERMYGRMYQVPNAETGEMIAMNRVALASGAEGEDADAEFEVREAPLPNEVLQPPKSQRVEVYFFLTFVFFTALLCVVL